ncbi:DUF885 domain-containing protein [Sphingomonas sp. PL-96]|uniref:DUF885 family protein n=1 Tax=Sphingomonas sp. PL-96 TaxID=2887201 RepID=UPI001E5C00E2|nr:DUF885 family protein [Sphingomonas sp. PL-96]MCC2977082.1 DUF885 domain-containing protein [Sphingomonas sp. PL-96]
MKEDQEVTLWKKSNLVRSSQLQHRALLAPYLVYAQRYCSSRGLAAMWQAPAIAALVTISAPAVSQATDPGLSNFFQEWRAVAAPETSSGTPDFTAPALARKRVLLTRMRAKFKALDRSQWAPAAHIDARLVEAEMNGLDFDLRVLRPWARDPGFYANVWAEMSDVPEHEGSTAPPIDLFRFTFPLSKADAAVLSQQLAAIPRLLDQARVNLRDGNARDLWRYSDQVLSAQVETLARLEAGTLRLRTLEGEPVASLAGTGPELRHAVRAARKASEAFRLWVADEARTKSGPSGIGKTEYDWYARNVHLVPYSWEEQRTLLQRELDRAIAGLRLEELHNRNLPQLPMLQDPAAYHAWSRQRLQRFGDFLISARLMEERPAYRSALEARLIAYRAPVDRDFFGHGTALDPMPLYSHFYHWVELARMREQPHPDPIRRALPLSNIYDGRAEGFATALEELAMQAGLYDDVPRGREIVYIMLANRAARGLASLHVQANAWDLAQAGRFHARWTPRGWSDANSALVRFEQLLYLRQPGYGTSYVIGKLQFDHLVARLSERADRDGTRLDMRDVFARFLDAGVIPVALIEAEMLGEAN